MGIWSKLKGALQKHIKHTKRLRKQHKRAKSYKPTKYYRDSDEYHYGVASGMCPRTVQ